MIRAGVVGASGLAGGELIRLITQHPDLELTFLGGSSSIGRRPSELHPGLRIHQNLTVQPVTEEVADKVDVLFLATPATVSADLAACSPTGSRPSSTSAVPSGSVRPNCTTAGTRRSSGAPT